MNRLWRCGLFIRKRQSATEVTENTEELFQKSRYAGAFARCDRMLPCLFDFSLRAQGTLRPPAFSGFVLLAMALAVLTMTGSAMAGTTLERVRMHKMLRCGVSEGLEGFSYRDPGGVWRGLDADFCRAVAAATLSDPGKVKFVPLAAPARFPALKMGTIDLLSRNTTYTSGREAQLGIHFAGIIYYDQQGIMVSRHSKARKLNDLNNATICIVKGATHESNLADYFGAHALKFRPLVVNSLAEGTGAFFDGRCQAYTSDLSQLAAIRLSAPGGAVRRPAILPDVISKEPLGPVVRRGDEEWLTLVKWVQFALIEAEERGIGRANARSRAVRNDDPSVRAFLGGGAGVGRALGIGDDWVVRVLQAVGNYGEMYDRNLGKNSRLKLDRGPNRLWFRGGLMYSPPMR